MRFNKIAALGAAALEADGQIWTGPGTSVVTVEAGESFGFTWQVTALEDDGEMTDPVCGQDSYDDATNG